MTAKFDKNGNIIIDKNITKFDELGRPVKTVYTVQDKYIEDLLRY